MVITSAGGVLVFFTVAAFVRAHLSCLIQLGCSHFEAHESASYSNCIVIIVIIVVITTVVITVAIGASSSAWHAKPSDSSM